MLVNGAHSEIASAGVRYSRSAESSQLRTEKVIRAAKVSDKAVIRCTALNVSAVDFHGSLVNGTDMCTHAAENLKRTVYVYYVRYILDYAFIFNKYASVNYRQGGIFKSADLHLTAEGNTTVYYDFFHK